MSTRDLIDAMSSGDSISIETQFNNSMAEKISAKIEDMRQSVAQNMFNQSVAEESVELDSEE